MNRVFITPSNGFINLAIEISKAGYELFTASAGFVEILSNSDVKCSDLNSVLTQEQWIAVHTDAMNLTAQVVARLSEFSHVLPEESKNAVGTSLLADIGRRISDFVAIISCLDEANLDLVIVHNDVDNTTRAVALWAKARGIPCLHVPHSIYLDSDDRPDNDVHSILSASHAIASGPFQYNWFMKNGMDLGNVFIAGIPTFDKVIAKYNIDHMRRLLRVNPDFPVVTYMSSWRQDTNLLGCHDGVEESYANFLEAAKKMLNDNVQIVVKCHPNGNNVPYHAVEAEKAGIKCIVTDKHLGPIISVSDVIVSYGPSNVVIESAIMNPNCGLVAINGFFDDEEVSSITEYDNMYEAIANELSSMTDKSLFIKKYVTYPDGKSSERIIKVIGEILESSS